MVPADHENGNMPFRQLIQKPVQEVHRLFAGDRTIIDIPGDDHPICPAIVRQLQDLPEDIPLVLQNISTQKLFAQVKITQMQQTHDVFFLSTG